MPLNISYSFVPLEKKTLKEKSLIVKYSLALFFFPRLSDKHEIDLDFPLTVATDMLQ